MINHFNLKPSRYFFILLLAIYCLSVAVIFLLPMPLWLALILVCPLLGTFYFYLRRDVWLNSPFSCVALRVEQGQVICIMREGASLPGLIKNSTLVTPMLTVVNIWLPELRRLKSVVIFSDSMDRESFRQLRVLLKWGEANTT